MTNIKLQVNDLIWIVSKRESEGYPWHAWHLTRAEAEELADLIIAKLVAMPECPKCHGKMAERKSAYHTERECKACGIIQSNG